MSSVFGTDRRVLVLAIARMADAIGNSFLIVVLPAYIASGAVSLEALLGTRLFGIALTQELLIGIVLSLFGFLNSSMQPFTGRLSDLTGRRRVFILAGLALLGVASAGYAVAESYTAIILLRALQGLGAALTIPATVALVNELATAADRGGNFGVFNTFRLIGFGVGPFLAGAVSEWYGFTAAFAVAVSGAAVSFALVSLLVSDPPTTTARASDDLALSIRGDGSLFDPIFSLGVATVCMGVGLALFATLRDPINIRLGQGDFWFGAQFGAAVLANVVLQVPVGRACDRYGRRPFIVAGFVVLVPAIFAQGLVTSSEAMLGARLLQGVAVALVFAPALAIAGDLAGEGQSGATLAVLTMGFGFGTALGPLASGYLVRFGFLVPFALGAILGLVGLIFVQSQVQETLPAATDELPEAG